MAIVTVAYVTVISTHTPELIYTVCVCVCVCITLVLEKVATKTKKWT